MEHEFKTFAVIDDYIRPVAAPSSGLPACLAESYPHGRFLALPDWAAALLFRLTNVASSARRSRG